MNTLEWKGEFVNINLPIDTAWYGWECYIADVVLFCNPQTIPVNQFDNTDVSVKCNDSEPYHKLKYTLPLIQSLKRMKKSNTGTTIKKLPVSTCQRGRRITNSIVDGANSVNNMRSRQPKTSAHTNKYNVLYLNKFQCLNYIIDYFNKLIQGLTWSYFTSMLIQHNKVKNKIIHANPTKWSCYAWN